VDEFCACPGSWYTLPTYLDHATWAFVCANCLLAVRWCAGHPDIKHGLTYRAKAHDLLDSDIKGVWPRAEILACLPSHIGGNRSSSLEATCGTCGLVSNPAALGSHQAATGHDGHAPVPTEAQEAEARTLAERAELFAAKCREPVEKLLAPLYVWFCMDQIEAALTSLGISDVTTVEQAESLRSALVGASNE
jgi:hypothetical protein